VGEVVLGEEVGDAEPATGPQHAETLGQHGILVARQVDHAVGDDHVHGLAGQRDGLDVAFEPVDVGQARPGLVGAGEVEHLVGHVEAVGGAGGGDATGGEQDVDAAPGAEVEHGHAVAQLGHRGRVAAAERGLEGAGGHLVALAGGVEAGAEPLGLLAGDGGDVGAAAAVRRRRIGCGARRGGVAGADAIGVRGVGQLSHAVSSCSASGIT
jgi:hypothetical protein